jgi:alkylation response protein AidB-like acyl-CoA dehydrogenase
LSGTKKKKRRAKDEILGGKTIDQVIALATDLGLNQDPYWRQRLAIEWTNQQLLRLTSQRSRANAAMGKTAGPEGSISKIAKASYNQSLQVLAMDLLGASATAWTQTNQTPASFVEEFLRTRANSIEGGTSEIQRNIVGERVLGLPREPDQFRGAPWRDVPRS